MQSRGSMASRSAKTDRPCHLALLQHQSAQPVMLVRLRDSSQNHVVRPCTCCSSLLAPCSTRGKHGLCLRDELGPQLAGITL